MSRSWDASRSAFGDAASSFVEATARVGDRWAAPGLEEWDVRSLVGHASRSLLTVEAYLAAGADRGRPVNGDDVRAALGQGMYAKFLWPELAAALAQLDAGDGAGIRDIADSFFGRNEDGSFSPGTDRYFLLSADEQRYPRDVRTFLRAGEASYRDYPHAYWNHGYSELAWGLYPIKAANPFTGPWRSAANAPTTLVVGTRYDPATPYQEAVRLVKQLGNARLLTMNGDGHTAYDGYPADGYNSRCTDAAVEAYLVDLRLPAVGTQCAQDQPAFSTAAAASAKTAAPAQVRERVVRPGTRPMLLP